VLSYTILASGSKGNATLIESPKAKVLIDCGISRKKLIERLSDVHLTLDQIDAIFLTHRHSDHSRGIPKVSEEVQVCLSEKLYSQFQEKIAESCQPHLFTSGEPFEFLDMVVHPVPVIHDCVDPVAFTVSCGAEKIALATDLGAINPELIEAFADCTAILMEANHDVNLLTQSPRPWHLKNRISGRKGHLSNRTAGRFLAQVYSPRLEEIVLMHLSAECNTPDIARATILEEFRDKNIHFACHYSQTLISDSSYKQRQQRRCEKGPENWFCRLFYSAHEPG